MASIRISDDEELKIGQAIDLLQELSVLIEDNSFDKAKILFSEIDGLLKELNPLFSVNLDKNYLNAFKEFVRDLGESINNKIKSESRLNCGLVKDELLKLVS
jgi:hypothetical protein